MYIVRGLTFHHWELILDDEHFFVTASYLNEKCREGFAKMMSLEEVGVQRVEGAISGPSPPRPRALQRLREHLVLSQ